MPMIGGGVLGVWHGIAPGMERTFDDWYNDEHNAERVAIDGFLRARRYVNLRRGRRYFCRYDVVDVAVLGSDAYLNALNNPTPRSQANFPHYRDTLRGAFKVAERNGYGDGGYVVTCRISSDGGQPTEDVVESFRRLGRQLLAQPAVTRVEHWEVDPRVTTITSQEKALRKSRDEFPEHVLVVDGTDPDLLEAAVRSASSHPVLETAEFDFCRLVLHMAKD